VDYLDDDGSGSERLAILVKITIHGRTAKVAFRGTAPQCRGNVNAVLAITESAVFMFSGVC